MDDVKRSTKELLDSLDDKRRVLFSCGGDGIGASMFEDKRLESCVRDELWKSYELITPEDIEGLTSLSCRGYKSYPSSIVSSLKGLELFTNLRYLYLEKWHKGELPLSQKDIVRFYEMSDFHYTIYQYNLLFQS